MLDFENQRTLGIIAGTLAQWLRDNPEKPEGTYPEGLDADDMGMRTIATGFLRMYYELIRLGQIKPPTKPESTRTH